MTKQMTYPQPLLHVQIHVLVKISNSITNQAQFYIIFPANSEQCLRSQRQTLTGEDQQLCYKYIYNKQLTQLYFRLQQIDSAASYVKYPSQKTTSFRDALPARMFHSLQLLVSTQTHRLLHEHDQWPMVNGLPLTSYSHTINGNVQVSLDTTVMVMSRTESDKTCVCYVQCCPWKIPVMTCKLATGVTLTSIILLIKGGGVNKAEQVVEVIVIQEPHHQQVVTQLQEGATTTTTRAKGEE